MDLEEYREKKYYIENHWKSQIRYLGGPGWQPQAEEYRQRMADELQSLKETAGSELVLMDKLS